MPSLDPELLATPFGLLINELCWDSKLLVEMICTLLDEVQVLDSCDPWVAESETRAEMQALAFF